MKNKFDGPYVARQGHYFIVEVLFITIDKQLQELNNRFNDQAMELLTLSFVLIPNDYYKAFNVEKCSSMNFNE